MDYSLIIDFLSLSVGILGLLLQLKEVRSNNSESITINHTYTRGGVYEHNMNVKRRIIGIIIFGSAIIYSGYLIYTNYGKITVTHTDLFMFPILASLNSYALFIAKELTQTLSFSVPILAFFITIKYFFSKKVSFKWISVISYSILCILSYRFFNYFTTIELSKVSLIIASTPNEMNSLLNFAKVYAGIIWFFQVGLFLYIIDHLVENLLLLENKSVLLDMNIATVFQKIAFPTIVLLINLYWIYIL